MQKQFQNHAFSSEKSTSRETRIGVVGLGYWGPNLVRVISDNPKTTLAWLCDTDVNRLAHAVKRYPGTRSTQSIQEVCADPTVDAVVIATPVYTHAELATLALRAGKSVLVEKPLAASSQQAASMIGLARRESVVLMCGHTFLFSPAVRAIKDLIDAGELGDIHFITSSRVNLGLHQTDVSVIWDLGPHDFSILNYWLGFSPHSVSAIGRDSVIPGVPDVAFIHLEYPNGIVAHAEMSWLAPSKLRRTVIVGSERMVTYEDGAAEPVKIFDHGVHYKNPSSYGEYQLSYRTGDIVSPKLSTYEPLAAQLEAFVGAIAVGKAPVSHHEQCMGVIGTIEAAEGSLAANGRRTSVAPSSALAGL